jgi:hypothetical protein
LVSSLYENDDNNTFLQGVTFLRPFASFSFSCSVHNSLRIPWAMIDLLDAVVHQLHHTTI